MQSKRMRNALFLCTPLLTGTILTSAEAAPLPLGANDWTMLYATFDRDLHAGQAKGNHYSAGSGTALVPGGLKGKALQSQNRLSTLVYAGSNMPVETGTVRLFIKIPAASNLFSDGKEYFIAAAERNVPVRYGTPEEMVKYPGFNFLLYKSTTDEIVFGLNNTAQSYIRVRGVPGGIPPHPMPVSLSIPTRDLAADAWHEVTISWDIPRHKYWLRVGDQLKTGDIPADYRAGAFDYLLLTTQPAVGTERQSTFPGLIDELLISNHPLDAWLAPGAPTEARREEAPPPQWPRATAKVFKTEPYATYEAQLRTALDAQAQFQNVAGGWTLSFAYPSGMPFTSGKTRTPQPANAYGNSKDGTSTLAAVRYAMAYEALGEPRYLDVAKRAADSLLRAQRDSGWWPYAWVFTDKGAIGDLEDRAPIEDHTQSAPIILMLYLNRLTGDARYRAAAEKGLDFLISAQNPNGSWSHHYNLAKKAGESASGQLNAGEFNDFTSTGTMKVMLLGYRMTGEQRFLDAYRRAADWILSAFIDKTATGGAAGWAQQYNAKNQPISARRFEPVAIENFASAMAASTLLNTYRMTGDTKYLEPARKWVKWLQTQGPQYTFYHDIETGRPIAAEDHKVYFLDDPAQAAGYKTAFEKTGQPYDIAGFHIRRDWIGIGDYMKQLADAEKLTDADKQPEQPVPTRAEIEQQLKTQQPTLEGLSKAFNWQMASYKPKSGTPGPRMSVGSPEWTRIAWSLARARALQGDLPLTNPLLRMPPRFETGEEVDVVAPHLNLYAPLKK